MDPNACLCYPIQPGVTQTFPQVLLTVRGLLSWWGGHICVPTDPHSCLQCRSSSQFTGDTQWSSGEGAHSQAAAASMSGSWDGLWQHGLQWARRQARFWVLAWVYVPCGDLTNSVICTVTLGLACLHISHHLRFGLLAYQLVTLWLVSKS
jgi:hypothetical protein